MTRAEKVVKIKGTIETRDGVVTEFQILSDFAWSQWGGAKEDLGATVPVMDAMVEGLRDSDVMADQVILDLAELDIDKDARNVVVLAEHRQSYDGPSVHGPFDTASEAYEYVIEQYETGEFDTGGCTVTYKEVGK